MYFEKPDSPRIFKNDYLDFFTRVSPVSIPVLFVPISLGFLYASTMWASVPWYLTALWFVVGFVGWTFTEYTLHRWLFHWEPDNAVGRTAHFFMHGVHHQWPDDPYRLVMPPWVNLTLLFAIVTPITLFIAPSWGYAFLAGYVVGYMNYDLTHYYIHHGKPKIGFFKRLKAHHINHHYNGDVKFGVSFTLWDHVFRTFKADPAARAKKVDATKDSGAHHA